MTDFQSFQWLLDSVIVQWFIAIILTISAILIIWQIRVQTNAQKGANFVKVIEMLNDEKMIQSIDALYVHSRLISKETDNKGKPVFTGIDDLKNTDESMPVDIKNHVIKVRETYHSVGVMLSTNLFDIIPFLMLQSSQVRDMWDLLSKNIKTVREQREKNKNDAPLLRGFEYLGELSNFWSIISYGEKSFLTNFPIFIPMPDSPLFVLRVFLYKKFQTNVKKKTKIKKR